jgi:hypothetical protein
MKTAVSYLGALLVAGALASVAHADHPFFLTHPCAVNCCGPAFNGCNAFGYTSGPGYPAMLPPRPFNGLYPVPRVGSGPGNGNFASFPTHPYARSPRDFFMVD